MVSEHIEKLVEDTHEKVNKIEQALRGYNGQPGLIKEHENLKADYYKFKRRAIGIFCFVAGSGALGVSAYQIFLRP